MESNYPPHIFFSVTVWCLNFVSGAHPHTHITFYPSPARFMKATLKQRVLFVGRFSFFACLPFYISNMGCNASTNLFALSSQLFYNYGSTFLDMMQHINLFFFNYTFRFVFASLMLRFATLPITFHYRDSSANMLSGWRVLCIISNANQFSFPMMYFAQLGPKLRSEPSFAKLLYEWW